MERWHIYYIVVPSAAPPGWPKASFRIEGKLPFQVVISAYLRDSLGEQNYILVCK